MSIQFPDTPTEGQTFTASNGVIYTYEDGGWKANAVSGLDDSYVNRTGDTMTGDLTVPNLISEGDVQTTSLNGGQLGGFRNQLINADFCIAQRAATGSGKGYITLDRWYQYNIAGNLFTQRQDGFGPFAQSMRILDNELSGEAYIAQGIELPFAGYQGKFELGSTWTLSFWSTVAPNSVNIAWQDSIAAAGGIANTVSPVVIGETQSGYTHYSYKVTISETAPTTAICLRVLIDYTAPVDTSITGVQLEPGPVATPFEHRPIGTELTLCQRYYQTIDNYALTGVTRLAGLSGTIYASGSLQTTMRKSPTGTRTTNMSRWNTGGDIIEQQAISDNVVYTSPYSVRIYFKGSWNVGLKIGYAQSGGGPGIMATLDAEL